MKDFKIPVIFGVKTCAGCGFIDRLNLADGRPWCKKRGRKNINIKELSCKQKRTVAEVYPNNPLN